MSSFSALLRASLLFGALEPGILQRLGEVASGRSFARGEYLFREGDAAESFTVVQRGLVRVVRATRKGEQTLVGIRGPRESVGDVAALERAPYPADAIAASEVVEVIRIPAPIMLETMQSDPNVGLAVQRALLEHTRTLRSKIDIMTAGAVPARLATLLLHLFDRFGDELQDGRAVVSVGLSRADLASFVSARVETVIRTISQWQKDGIVKTTQGGFEIQIPQLRAIAELG